MSSPHTQATSTSGHSAIDTQAGQIALASSNHAHPFTTSFPPGVARDGYFAGEPATFALLEWIMTASGWNLTCSPKSEESGPGMLDLLVYSEGHIEHCERALAQSPEDALWHVRTSSDGWLEVLKRPENGTVRYECGRTPPVTLLRVPGKFEVAIKVILRGEGEVKTEEAGDVKAEDEGEVKAEEVEEVKAEEFGEVKVEEVV